LSILKIPTAKVFEPLLQPARYKGVFGGRGSGKSHFFGELLVETCQAERGTLAVCIRGRSGRWRNPQTNDRGKTPCSHRAAASIF
jgi:hypothetical protein